MTTESPSKREIEAKRNREIMREWNPEMLAFIEKLREAFPHLKIYELTCPVKQDDYQR